MRPRLQPPGAYVRVALREPMMIPGYRDRPEPRSQVTLRLAGPVPPLESIQPLPDGALLVIAALGSNDRIETYHFPSRTISHWVTYTVTEEDYAEAIEAERRHTELAARL